MKTYASDSFLNCQKVASTAVMTISVSMLVPGCLSNAS
jgi:hypothetical protein